MAGRVEDYILDNGLHVLNTECNRITLCETEPTTFDEAAITMSLGFKAFATFGAFGVPEPSTNPAGEKVTLTFINDGTVSRSGTAAYWAAVDIGNSRLHARGTLASPTSLSTGTPWVLEAFDVVLPSGVSAPTGGGGWNAPGTLIAGM